MEKEEMLKMVTECVIRKDGTFKFRCTQCGKCCYGHSDIILSPFDVTRMARHLHMDNADVIRQYAVVLEGAHSHLPVIVLRMRPDGGCVLLDGKKCRVHTAKPSVCGLYPLGRAMSISQTDHSRELLYFLQPVDCGDASETHTPQDWLASFGMSNGEAEFEAWASVVGELAELAMAAIPKLPYAVADMVLATMVQVLYCEGYEDAKDVVQQVLENGQKAKNLLDLIQNNEVVPVDGGDA